MIAVEYLLNIAAVILLVPVSIVLLQVLLALTFRGEQPIPSVRRPRVTVLIPAHNEALGIAEAVATIKEQLEAGDGLLVVADNCTDDTKDIAVRIGAEVIERKNAQQQGKGFALDYGIRYLESDPPDIVIIIDADCAVEPGTIEELALRCAISGAPMQAYYRMMGPKSGGLMARVAEFAWLMKNFVRPLGFLRVNLPCQLMGTGMAFPWSLLANADLATGNLVEDLKLGIDLALSGHPARFCPSAEVTSKFPSNRNVAHKQRTRWEHGHLDLIVRSFPRLIARSIVSCRRDACALVLDLAVPPLASLMLLAMLLFGLNTFAVCFNISLLPFVLSALVLAMLGAAVLLAWQRWGRQVLTFGDLLCAPLYAASKIPLYARFWTARQKEWVRTDRDGTNGA